MSRMTEAVRDYLLADPTLVGLLPGGVYAASIVPPGGGTPAEDPTPDAFDPATGFVLGAASVVDFGEAASPTGPNVAVAALPEVAVYGPPTAAGKALVEDALGRVRVLLEAATIESGGGVLYLVAATRSRLPVNPTLDFPGWSSQERFQVTYLWRALA